MIGATNTLVYYIVYSLLVASTIHYLISSVIAYCLGVANSFLLNRRFTFRHQASQAWRPEFAKFLVVNIFALMTNIALLQLIVTSGSLSKEAAAIPAILGSLTVNFLGNLFWTFNDRIEDSNAKP